MVRRRHGERGQAAVELVALLPLLAALLAGLWQAALWGHASWAVAAAARAAARAAAVDADPRRAARAHLPRALERGLRVRVGEDGTAAVRTRVPPVPGLPRLGTVSARA